MKQLFFIASTLVLLSACSLTPKVPETISNTGTIATDNTGTIATWETNTGEANTWTVVEPTTGTTTTWEVSTWSTETTTWEVSTWTVVGSGTNNTWN